MSFTHLEAGACSLFDPLMTVRYIIYFLSSHHIYVKKNTMNLNNFLKTKFNLMQPVFLFLPSLVIKLEPLKD